MATPKESYYEKRAQILMKNLERRHFEAYYVPNKEEAGKKVLELIPQGSTVGWGGSMTATALGVMDALKNGNYTVIDRDQASNPQELVKIQRRILGEADAFVTGCNALSMEGEMVNIDGQGNRVAAICYGPENVVVVAGMNKVTDDLEAAIQRARTVAAPMNKQRFPNVTGCSNTGVCADCHSKECICNQIVITRNCRPVGRIKFVLVGEDLGF